MASALVLFRQDLRLSDNPALNYAIDNDLEVIPVFIWSPEDEGAWPAGAASKAWLAQSLRQLDDSLLAKGLRLILRQGPYTKVLHALVDEVGPQGIYWNHDYEPALVARDIQVHASYAEKIECKSFNARLLVEPWELKTLGGTPFQVFTPFWKKFLKLDAPPLPRSLPKKIKAPKKWPKSLHLQDLDLESSLPWSEGFWQRFSPGEKGAQRALKRFIQEAVTEYSQGRDRPDFFLTSRLSPHLHFGEIAPRAIWAAAQEARTELRSTEARKNLDQFLKEVGWREFAYHLLYHFPQTANAPLRKDYEKFPWEKNQSQLEAWQKGLTGYPIVDAGMRELWQTGWMHNRVRMIVASFLVKDLRLNWLEGARWFWDTLVDADLASNTLGWQWSAGCGADAAPYFRVFNPTLQGERFDPEGTYVKTWVPELAKVPPRYVHRVWEASEAQSAEWNVKLGKNYPSPIVDHGEARLAALQAFKKFRKK